MSEASEPKVLISEPPRDDGIKVFCIDCAFYHGWCEAMGCGGEECKAVYDIQHTYKHTRIVYGDPSQINKGNQCHHYKDSRWFLFVKAIRRYKKNIKKWLKYPMSVFRGNE